MIRPGSFIEWYTSSPNRSYYFPVPEETTMFSLAFDQYCYIGSDVIHMCIAIDDEKIAWINRYGVFQSALPGINSFYKVRSI